MEVTPAESKAIATLAYLFLTPLVTNYVRMYDEAVDASSPEYRGGFGTLFLRRTSATEARRTTAQTTSLRSSAWLDLRSEPWVVSIPAMRRDQAHAVRTLDLWGFVADDVPDDNHGVSVLIASPNWVGDVPRGVDRVARGESFFVETELVVRTREPESGPQVGNVLKEVAVTPLSALMAGAPPPAAPRVGWWPIHGEVRTDDEFWSAANFALSLTTPHESDRAILERIGRIGIGPARRWDGTQFDDHVREAISEGMDDAITELMRASAGAGSVAGTQRSRTETDRDYFARALAALRRDSVVHADSG